MKKIILFVICLIAALANAQSPTFQWAKAMGGYYGYAWGTSVVVDVSGNVFTTGNFEGRVDFDPGAGVSYLTSAGLYDVFITKVDASGNFVWAKQMGGTADDRGNSIVVNSAGNIIVIGNFTGTADFDPGAAVYNLISAGFDDIFISMIDASGNFSWARQIGGTKMESGNAIAIDAANNIYITGYFEWIVDFDPGAGNFTLISGGSTPNVFISKLNSNGDFVWAKQMEGGISKGESIAIDPSGNIYTAGTFTSTTDFDPGIGTFNLTGAGSPDIFISKLNASGNFIWAKQYGGSVQYDPGSIKTDASGNIYIAGTFTGTSDFDPGPAVYNLTSSGIFDIFISKLDASGNLILAISLGGSGYDIANSLALDGTGNIYVTGYFGGTVDFDPGAGTFSLTAAALDIFVLKLNNSGNFIWAKAMGGTANDFANSVAVNAAGNVLITGYFYNTVDFDPGPGTYNLVALDGNFLFTLNLDVSGNFVWAKSAGAGASTLARAMTTDLSGNVYTTGYFYGIIDFDPGPGIFNLTSGATDIYGDVFITKCNTSGNLIWAKKLGGTLRDYGSSIGVDVSGNVYTAGNFNGTVDFDPGAGIFNLTGSDDSFISKLDAFGNFVWAAKINSSSNASMYSLVLDASGNIFTAGMDAPGTNSFQIFLNKIDPLGNLTWSKTYGGTSYDGANAIATDASGNIYITGCFSGTVDFDPNTGIYNLTAFGGKDIFISKLDGSGNFIWAKQIGAADQDEGSVIAVDPSGKVYVGGSFLQTVDFDPGPGTANMTSIAYNDIFITKLDNSGNFIWAKQFAGGSTDYMRSIKLDNSGNVYTTGSFAGTIDFDPGTGTFNLTTANSFDIFISKLDDSGHFIWAQQIGSAQYDDGYSIALDGTDNIYTCGTFLGTADFDPGSGISNITAKGDPDLFINKLSQCIPPSAIVTPSGPTTFCSGGSVVLNAPVAANRSYQWKKGANLISGAILSSYTATTGGNYRVIVTNTVTGCSKTTNSATTVTVNALPAATITPQGPTTFCAGGSVVLAANTGTGLTYKWKKGSSYISGATLSNYTATTGGNYRVQVTNGNGCSKTSALIAVSVPCKEGESLFSENSFDIKVFPNPSSGDFSFEIWNARAENISIKVYDMIGKLVLSETIHNSTLIIHNSQLSPGVYSSVVSDGNNKKVIKLVKSK